MGILKAVAATFMITFVEAIALFYMKHDKKWGIYIAMPIFGLCVVPLLAYSLEHEGVGMVNFLWTISSIVVMFALGVYIFNERVHHLHLIGISMCMAGIALILLSHEDVDSIGTGGLSKGSIK
jgi:multidrug transporter EmrE-like cation transporter